MLLASWTFYTILKGFRSFNAENVGSLGQRAANLPAIKVWEWFDPGPPRTRADWFECGRGHMADFFVRPPTLTTGNFEAIWPKDLKISATKDLNRFKKYAKYQEASSILWVGFALSKWPHLHRAYVVTVPFILILAVCFWQSILNNFETPKKHQNLWSTVRGGGSAKSDFNTYI